MYFFLPEHKHKTIYFYSLLFAIVSVVWGKMFITLSSSLLLLHFIAEGNYKIKLKNTIKNKGILLFSVLFFYQFIGLIYTSNTDQAIKWILASLPLIVFPLAIISRESMQTFQLKKLLFAFLISLWLNTIFNILHYTFFLPESTDIRELSRFMSHIRYSLYLNLSIAITIYYVIVKPSVCTKKEKAILIILGLWFIGMLLILHSMTGIVLLILLFIFYAYIILKKLNNNKLKTLLLVFILTFFTIIGFAIVREAMYFISPDSVSVEMLDIHSKNGEKYVDFSPNGLLENGHHVKLYIAPYELKHTWDSISNFSYTGKDKKGQPISYTINRYLTSKNLRKDREGVLSLNPEDINNIESGLTNYRFANKYSLSTRIYEVFWEIDVAQKGMNPSFHSFTQRFLFYDCAISVLKKNVLLGVGTGDIKDEMHKVYKEKAQLPEILWRKPHTQFLDILVRYGIIGFLFIAYAFFYSVKHRYRFNPFYISIWLIISLISMLVEDTLENYNGIALFALFGGLFFGYKEKLD